MASTKEKLLNSFHRLEYSVDLVVNPLKPSSALLYYTIFERRAMCLLPIVRNGAVEKITVGPSSLEGSDTSHASIFLVRLSHEDSNVRDV